MSNSRTSPSARSVRSQLGFNSLLTIVLAVAVLGLLNYFGYRYYYRHDFSKGSYYRLSEKTVRLLQSLPEPVTISTSLSTSPIRAEIETLLREYKYKGRDKVHLEFIDSAVDLTRAEELAKKYGLDPSKENVVILEYKDKHQVLNDTELADWTQASPMTGQAAQLKAFKGEQQFTSALQSLYEGKTSRVYFLTGHGERDLRNTTPGGLGGLAIYLGRDNLAAGPLNLAATPAVPADADALVIAGPRIPLTPGEVQAVAAYLDAKGKVIVLQDPQVVSGLEPVLQRYGIQLQDDRVLARVHMGGADVLLHTAQATVYADHPAVRALKGLNLQLENARSLAPAKDPANPNLSKVVALAKTPDAIFWGETNFDDPKPQYDAGTDIAGPLTLAMAYDGGELPGDAVKLAGTRLAVVGSSTFLTNEKLDATGLDFFLNLLNWMLKKDAAMGISPRAPQEFGLNVGPLQKSTIIFLCLVFAPGVAAAAGAAVWFSRRK
jgi:hypothetical protein